MKLFVVLAAFVALARTQDLTVDFAIVGGGTAGAVLASRLSEKHNWKILLIDAGESASSDTNIPLNVNRLPQDCRTTFDQKTDASDNFCLAMNKHECKLAQGKGLGGSSVLSDMIYSRGNAQDFELWKGMGNNGWGQEDVVRYFEKLENNKVPDTKPECAGIGGPITISYVNFRSDIARAFIAAGEELGSAQVNYNCLNQNGFSYVQTMLKEGKRQSTSSAYLDPLLQYDQRNNLQILKNSVVTKLLFDDDNDHVTGLVYKKFEFSHTVRVTREVILSAGAFITPKILMLSGIGPAKHLKQLRIPVIKDLPVGENLVDHVGAGALTFFSNSTAFDLNAAFTPESLKKFAETNDGPLSSPGGVEALAFLNSKKSSKSGYPDYELLLTSGSLLSSPMVIENYNLDKSIVNKWLETVQDKKGGAFTITPILLRPKSRGNVLLRSANPSDSVIVNPNYFSEQCDIKVLIKAIRKALDLVKTKAFQKVEAQYFSEPLAQCAQHSYYSNEYWECYVRHFTFSQYRHASTARMGPADDSKAVVNARLRVHGIKGLRIVDASVMPQQITGHSDGVMIMIAEKAADMIKEDYRKKPYHS